MASDNTFFLFSPMFSVTEQELQDLIDKHNGKDRDKEHVPVYDLKTVVEHGLMFLYAKKHLRNGKVQPCTSKLDIYKKHKCIERDKHRKLPLHGGKLSVIEISTLEKTQDTLKTCWTGNNLAILTSDFTLQGYFKKDMLFQKQFPQASAIVATTEKICIGLFTGEVVYFDPISMNEMRRPCHTDTVTAMHNENSNILSASMDGSIFYRKKIHISNSGVLDAHRITDMKFVCSCGDNSIVQYDTGEVHAFTGHMDRIKSLTHDRFTVSSSKDGRVGFLSENGQFEIAKMGASFHQRRISSQIVCYGLDDIFLYDAVKKQRVWACTDASQSLDVKGDVIVYSHGNGIRIVDIRSDDTLNVAIEAEITDLSFSKSDNTTLLVCTDRSPMVVDIRCT